MNINGKIAVDGRKTKALHGLLMVKERRITYLSKDEIERFFKAIPTENLRDRLLFDLIYRHGLRRQEAAYLRTECIREGKRLWIFRLKGGVAGEYPLHPSSQELVKQYRQDRHNPRSPFLITSRQSSDADPIDAKTIYLLFKQYAIQAGLPVEKQHVHILRHSIAVHLMNAGWDLADVQDWLGHKSINSTIVYAKITNKRREINHAKTIESEEIAKTKA